MISFTHDFIMTLIQAAEECGIPACTMSIFRTGEEIFTAAIGECHEGTLFDLASVTKLFTSSAFLQLADRGMVRPEDPVCAVLREFQGLREIRPFPEPLIEGHVRDVSGGFSLSVPAEKTTFSQLLTHSSGLPAWLPLYKLTSVEAIRDEVMQTHFSYQPGSDVVYSDIGLILTGWAVEALCGCPLDTAIRELVTAPLGLDSIRFRRLNDEMKAEDPLPREGIAPTDICHWRGYRLIGEVEDENCAALRGVSGHAGLFGTAHDLAAFGTAFLPGSDFLKQDSLQNMTSLRMSSRDGSAGRGYGFQHWSADSEAFFYPMSSQSFGHTGFTGTAIWIDPDRDISAALLTNEVYNGRYNRRIAEFRRKVFAGLPAFLEEV